MRATNVNKAMIFAPRTIKSASLILWKGDNESKYVGTSAMASSINNKKMYVITAKKRSVKNIKKPQLFLQVRNWG